MDEKLTTMAKSTVFACCTRRQLLQLGGVFELSLLPAGTALPEGTGGPWVHVILRGEALAAAEGTAWRVVSDGDIWPSPDSGGAPKHGRGHGHAHAHAHAHRHGELIALSEVTLASVSTRSLGVVARSCPQVAASLTQLPAQVVNLDETLRRLAHESAGGGRLVGSRPHD